MAKRKPGQLPLGAAAPRRKGSAERDAELDLRSLRAAATIPPGMKAIETAYRLIAREVDRAELEQDRYGKLNAARELRALRERLGVIQPVTGTDADGFWDEMADNGPDPAQGDRPQP
jgi:hypothetical protein